MSSETIQQFSDTSEWDAVAQWSEMRSCNPEAAGCNRKDVWR